MPKTSNKTLTCDLCGAENPAPRMGRASRGFSVRQGESRVAVSTDGERPVCLDMRGCFQRALTKGLDSAVPQVEAMEHNRHIRNGAEREANERGETTHKHTEKVVRGRRLVRRANG